MSPTLFRHGYTNMHVAKTDGDVTADQMLLSIMIANMTNKECRRKIMENPGIDADGAEHIVRLFEVAASVSGPNNEAEHHPQSVSAIAQPRYQQSRRAPCPNCNKSHGNRCPEITCPICKKRGHTAATCYRKKQHGSAAVDSHGPSAEEDIPAANERCNPTSTA